MWSISVRTWFTLMKEASIYVSLIDHILTVLVLCLYVRYIPWPVTTCRIAGMLLSGKIDLIHWLEYGWHCCSQEPSLLNGSNSSLVLLSAKFELDCQIKCDKIMRFFDKNLQLMSIPHAIPHSCLHVCIPLFDDRWTCISSSIELIIWLIVSSYHSAIRSTASKHHFALKFGDSVAICLYF